MTRRDPAYVAVIGAGEATERQSALAERCGRLLARAGVVVLSGGLSGVMDASCRGCAAEGGQSIALLPGRDRSEATPHATFVVPTGLGQIRNAVLIDAADVVLAVGGGWGTLNEIALAVRRGTPIVLLETWHVEPPEGTPSGDLFIADDPDAAVSAVCQRLADITGHLPERDSHGRSSSAHPIAQLPCERDDTGP